MKIIDENYHKKNIYKNVHQHLRKKCTYKMYITHN